MSDTEKEMERMTYEESLAYKRGYNMARALYALRDAADRWLAQFCPDDNDPMHADINAKIDQADEVLARIGKWLKEDAERECYRRIRRQVERRA